MNRSVWCPDRSNHVPRQAEIVLLEALGGAYSVYSTDIVFNDLFAERLMITSAGT